MIEHEYSYDTDEAVGVIETLDLMDPIAMNSPLTASKHDQAGLVKTIGERMRQARELCNLSQSEAARRLGYANPSKLSKIEAATDTCSVPLWSIAGAAKVYQVSMDFLFGITADWEKEAPRSAQEWLLDSWEKMRQRDMRALDRVHAEVVTVAATTAELVAAVRGLGDAMTMYRARNEGFDDSPASAPLVGRLARLEAIARDAEVKLRRLQLRGRDDPRSDPSRMLSAAPMHKPSC